MEECYLADLNTVDGNGGNTETQPQAAVNLIANEEDKALVKGTSGNHLAPPADLRYNFDKGECVVYIKLLSLFVSQDSHKREVLPQQLCPLMRLLAACYDER